jgi:hypothetical protein
LVPLALVSALAASCTYALKAYPVCQYNGDANVQVVAVTNTVREWLHDQEKAMVLPSPDSKWLIIKARKRWHRVAAPVWPALGCVGTYASDVTHAKYAACLKTLEEMIRRGDVTVTGDRTDSLVPTEILFCNGK